MSTKPEPVQCSFIRVGPRVGRNVVAWRAQCQRKTTDPSGRCPSHRKTARTAPARPDAMTGGTPTDPEDQP